MRLTYFWDAEMNYENMLTFKLITQLVHERVTALIKKTFDIDLGIEVLHQLSAYPYLNESWFIVQFRCDYNKVGPVKKIMLNEFIKISKEGISIKEIDNMKRKLADEDEFWLRDNQYWLTTLTDYSAWQWPISTFIGSYKEFSNKNSEDINSLLKKLFASRNTLIYSKPIKGNN